MWLRVVTGVLAGVFGLFLGGERTAYAHERWFVEEGAHAAQSFSFDGIMGLVLSSTVLLVGAVLAVDRISRQPTWRRLAKRTENALPIGMEWRVLAGFVGIMLIANALTGVFLAPNLVPEAPWFALVSRVAQVIIGLLLFSQVLFTLAGALVLAAIPLALLFFPMGLLVDYVFEYAAVGLAFIFVGLSACPDRMVCRMPRVNQQRYAGLALTTARVGVGLTFAALALHNKLLDPNLALTFLDKYPYMNFMPLIGFSNFSNLHFVFATGVVELAVGLLLVAGIATRFVAAIVTGLLLTTLAILGPAELIGHLPIIGLALLFVYRGSGPHRIPALGHTTASSEAQSNL